MKFIRQSNNTANRSFYLIEYMEADIYNINSKSTYPGGILWLSHWPC